MRVAFAHYGVTADVSGVTSWIERFVKHLHGERSQTAVHVLGLGREHWSECSIARELAPTGARLSGGSLWRLGCSEEAVRDTLAFLNDFRPDVFLPQCLPGFHHAAKWAGERGVPWVFTMHADDPVYWALAEQCGPDAAHGAWVVVSSYLADRVRDRFPAARVVTIPCGVAMPAGRATYRDRPFRVVYSGRLAEVQKRASLVVATLITACRRCDSIEAVVLGDGTARESMQQAVSAAGLTDRIRFAGRVPPERVGGELLNAQAILLMSDFEGLPVALMEAMAHGVVPVARSIASGIPELVYDGETGLLVDESPDRAAAAIVSLADDQRRWEAMSTAARRLVGDRYSDTACFAAWRRLIDELSRSERNAYPLPGAGRIKLPPVHPGLRGLDIRRPTLWRRMGCIAGSVGRRSRAAAARLLVRQRHDGN